MKKIHHKKSAGGEIQAVMGKPEALSLTPIPYIKNKFAGKESIFSREVTF
jgi:hypothetical protein